MPPACLAAATGTPQIVIQFQPFSAPNTANRIIQFSYGEDGVDRSGADLVDGLFQELDQVLGIFYSLPDDDKEELLTDELQALVEEREVARKEKNWARADEIRDHFLGLGYVLEDTPGGPVLKPA